VGLGAVIFLAGAIPLLIGLFGAAALKN
jgi:hypothetical protein